MERTFENIVVIPGGFFDYVQRPKPNRWNAQWLPVHCTSWMMLHGMMVSILSNILCAEILLCYKLPCFIFLALKQVWLHRNWFKRRVKVSSDLTTHQSHQILLVYANDQTDFKTPNDPQNSLHCWILLILLAHILVLSKTTGKISAVITEKAKIMSLPHSSSPSSRNRSEAGAEIFIRRNT